MEKTGPKSYGGYAWAEESLLSGGSSPFIIFNDDDDDDDMVSISELFARTDPALRQQPPLPLPPRVQI
jgi:hypothetical protein